MTDSSLKNNFSCSENVITYFFCNEVCVVKHRNQLGLANTDTEPEVE